MSRREVDPIGDWAGAPNAIGNVMDAMVRFQQVDLYTTFRAEYTCKDEAILVHFFIPREKMRITRECPDGVPDRDFLRYWMSAFAVTLSDTAMAHFGAMPPTLIAQYTPELNSWYMRAGGFALVPDPDGLIMSFFEKLDMALDSVGKTP